MLRRATRRKDSESNKLATARGTGILVVVPAILLEVLGHEVHRGRQSDSADNCAHHANVMTLGDNATSDQGSEKSERRRNAAGSVLWSYRIFLVVPHVDLLLES
jgi:hypothetical protein